MQVLVTRPQPEAARTAARLTGLGHKPMLAPLLTTTAIDWQLPATLPEAVAFTSAAAVRLAGPQLAGLRQLPVFAVGEATAQAAYRAGFGKLVLEPRAADRAAAAAIDAAPGTAAALFAQIAASGFARVLYLAGRDRAARGLPPQIELHEVYVATLAPALPAAVLGALAANAVDVTLLYSARTAAHFAALADAASLDRSALRIAALSPPVLAAAGPGWGLAIAAPEPAETALLVAAGLLR